MEVSPILILGCERSGSTWLLNILDSSASTVCYMEPFADYAGLFPGFPHRFSYLKDITIDQEKWVENKFLELYARKFGFFYKPGRSLFFKKLDKSYLKSIKKFNRFAGIGISKKIEQYELLNLTGIDFKKNPHKNDYKIIIKELRLNFKLHLIRSLFPHSRIVVAVRNPVLQIESILKKFAKNRLDELKRSLLFFASHIIDNPRFSVYKSCLSGFSEMHVIEQLSIFWLVSYNTIIEDVEDCMLPYIVANNDIISLNPKEEIKNILDFCDIEIDGQVRDYLMRSTMANSDSNNSVDTNRKSRDYYLDKVQQVDLTLKERVLSIVDTELLNQRLRTTIDFQAVRANS